MILHVACLPFPTHQGTQAAIAAMLHASAASGRHVEVLTYAQSGYALDPPYEVHRVPDFPKVRSLRSGPSWGKLALDVRCVLEIQRLAKRRRPEAIIAHHIEAGVAALAARVAPVYYVAHTSLQHELPVYVPSLPPRIVGEVSRRVEQSLSRAATGVAAVAPSLATLLGRGAKYLPVPWSSPPGPPPRRVEARRRLGIASDAKVCLYAGNLDRYQGWEHLIEALAVLRRSRPCARLLIATESDPAPARAEAALHGLAHAIDVRRLDGEKARRLVHAASDLAWIPRKSQGGLPIKMLDAFARELPVVAMARATADLAIDEACVQVPNDDAHALSEGARLLFDSQRSDALREAGLQYLTKRHSSSAFDAGLAELFGETEAAARKVPPPQRDLAHRRQALSTYASTRLFLDPE